MVQFEQLPQTPGAASVTVLQVNVRELCLDNSDDGELTTNRNHTLQKLGEKPALLLTGV